MQTRAWRPPCKNEITFYLPYITMTTPAIAFDELAPNAYKEQDVVFETLSTEEIVARYNEKSEYTYAKIVDWEIWVFSKDVWLDWVEWSRRMGVLIDDDCFVDELSIQEATNKLEEYETIAQSIGVCII